MGDHIMGEHLGLEDRVIAALRYEGLIAQPRRSNRIARIAAAMTVIALLIAGPMLVRSLPPDRPDNLYMLALYSGETYVAAAPGVRAAEYGDWARDRAQAVVDGAELIGRPALFGRASDQASTLSGYFIVQASNEADALAIARSAPHVRHGGTIVVRRIGR